MLHRVFKAYQATGAIIVVLVIAAYSYFNFMQPDVPLPSNIRPENQQKVNEQGAEIVDNQVNGTAQSSIVCGPNGCSNINNEENNNIGGIDNIELNDIAAGCIAEHPGLDTEEKKMVQLINQFRQENGKSAYAVSQKLNVVAANLAEDMAANGYRSNHTDSQGRSLSARLSACGVDSLTAQGENIGSWPTTEQQFNDWKASTGHRNNMLGSYAAMGVARAKVSGGHMWATPFLNPNPGGTATDDNSTDTVVLPTATKTPTPIPATATPVQSLPTATPFATQIPQITSGQNLTPTTTLTQAPSGFGGQNLSCNAPSQSSSVQARVNDIFSTADGETNSGTICPVGQACDINISNPGKGTTPPTITATPVGTTPGTGIPPLPTITIPPLSGVTPPVLTLPSITIPSIAPGLGSLGPLSTLIPSAGTSPLSYLCTFLNICPSGSPTPSPSVAVTPSVSPSVTTSITPSITGTTTISPTGTQNTSGTKISVSLLSPGLGSNNNQGKNSNPISKTINSTLNIYNLTGQKILSKETSLAFDTNTGAFKSTVDVGSIPTGDYQVKLGTYNSLCLQLNDLSKITSGQTTAISQKTVITGDINQDNQLSLPDYNAIISCFGSKTCSQKAQSDLNLDGKVDEKDINIFYSGLAKRKGD